MLEDEAEFDRKWGNVMDAIERDPELKKMVCRQQKDIMLFCQIYFQTVRNYDRKKL
jgi:hypothetical protein